MRELKIKEWKNYMTNRIVRIAIISIISFLLTIQTSCKQNTTHFDQTQAFSNVEYQTTLGPRTIGSSAHAQFVSWTSSTLRDSGWEVDFQVFNWAGNQLTNIIAKRNTGNPWIVLGAHYDSRFFADRDPDTMRQTTPVPGANDGASGVAVLLELARVLPSDLDKNVWIALFDAEDNGNISGWEWIIGSRVFAANLVARPDAVIIIDMIGDEDLTIYKERNSDAQLQNEIWGIAEELGYSQFIPDYKHQILDDHIPFMELGIPAVDIIDFDYPYWHTTQDTLDKISPNSLNAVGEVLLTWLIR
jgi:glutaminyl-peptide cyclotransferase